MLRTILAALAASGVLPACAGNTSDGRAGAGEPGDLRPAPQEVPPPPEDVRAPGPTTPGEVKVCTLTKTNGVRSVRCETKPGPVPDAQGTRTCAADEACFRGERCFETGTDSPPTKRCFRQLGAAHAACSVSHDCAPSLDCVLPEGATHGTCEDACAYGCEAGTVCVPTISIVTTVPSEPGARPVDAPGPFRCLPADRRSYVRAGEDPCRDSGDACSVVEGTWKCAVTQHREPYRCGRPLLVDAVPRVATSGAPRPGVGLDDGTDNRSSQPSDSRVDNGIQGEGDDGAAAARVALATRIREIAYDEHASIVAFSRTITALGALGAPLPLLRATAAALADEVEHAALAFALLDVLDPARRGERPGAFEEAVAPHPSMTSLRAHLIVDTVRGGCVGETGSAIDAARKVADPVVAQIPEARTFFEKVAADEARHAALAFETLAWLAGAEAERWALAEQTVVEVERELAEAGERPEVIAGIVRPLMDGMRAGSAAF